MLQFHINTEKCTRCGLCIDDCPASIIEFNDDNLPTITVKKQDSCYKCQHCLAICPTAALSILGHDPLQSRSLIDALPDPDRLETLIRGRRSVRRYRDEDLDPALIRSLLDTAWQSPTGVNDRRVRFSLIDRREELDIFRKETYEALGRLATADKLPEERKFFAGIVNRWQEQGIDIIFRGAPHLLVASAPRDAATPLPDCLISLAYFELFAQSLGVGTVWNGLFKWTIDELVPQLRQRLNIPDQHLIGYAMAFGKPAIQYERTIDHGPAEIVRFKG